MAFNLNNRCKNAEKRLAAFIEETVAGHKADMKAEFFDLKMKQKYRWDALEEELTGKKAKAKAEKERKRQEEAASRVIQSQWLL